MDKNILKQYTTQLRKARESVDLLKLTIKQTEHEIHLKHKSIRELEKKVKDLTKNDLTVSEHAILRYCERVLGIDIDGISKIILNDTLRKQVDLLGRSGTYPVEDTCKAVLKDGVVVTIKT